MSDGRRPIKSWLLSSVAILPPVAPLAVPSPTAAPMSTGAPLADVPDDESIQEYVTDPLSESVVRIYVSRQEVDTDSPWRKRGVEIHQVAGAVVAGGKVLTSAQAVLDATFIELSRFGESHRYELVPEFVDQEVDLALLRPTDAGIMARLTPLSVDGLLPVRGGVDAVAWQGSQIVRTRVHVADIAIRKAPTSNYDLAAYLLDGLDQSFPSSMPLVRKGRLSGLVTEGSEGAPHAIPASIIHHFLDDAAAPPGHYRGFAGLGLETTPLVSPDARRYFKAAGVTGGVRIVDVLPGGPTAAVIRRDDILLKVAGHELDDYGRYRHPFWGRVSYKYLLNELYGGQPTTVTVVRDGQIRTFTVTLPRFDSGQGLIRRVPGDVAERAYVVVAGLLFTELRRSYLENWGSAWRETAPVELVMASRRLTRESSGGAVVLSRVLADDINQGYEDLANRLVDKINGEAIATIADVDVALGHPVVRSGKSYMVVTLAYDQGLVVLPYSGLAAANARIAAKYGIDAPTAFFIPGLQPQ